MFGGESMPIDLDAIEARVTAATPEPWAAQSHGPYPIATRVYGKADPPTVALLYRAQDHLSAPPRDELTLADHDAEFIAHAREDVPALIAEVKRLQGICEAVAQQMLGTQYDDMVRKGPEFLAQAVEWLRADHDKLRRERDHDG